MLGIARLRTTSLLLLTILMPAGPADAQVTFAVPASYTAGTNPEDVTIADLNGDGIPDLAIANRGDASIGDQGSVSVLLGNSDGTFQPALASTAGPFPKFIFGGDFNGDSRLDLLVLGEASPNTGLSPWSVLLGQGDGTFQATTQIAPTHTLFSMVTADLNRDKKLDLIFIDGTGLQEMLGNGDGTFRAAQVVLATGGQVSVGDFNGDGKADLAITGNPNAPDVILLGNGDGTLGAPQPQPTSSNSAVVQDLNHDGRSDLIMESSHTSTCGIFHVTKYSVASYIADSKGMLQHAQEIASSSIGNCGSGGGYSISIGAIGDFDGDGNEDVSISSSIGGQEFFAGRGDGTFPTNLETLGGSFSVNQAAADLDGDRLADLVELSPPTSVNVILNATPTFSLAASVPGPPIHAGSSTTYSIATRQQHGFTATVTLTCLAPLSDGIRCSLSPSSVRPGESSTLTVTTNGASAGLGRPASQSHSALLYALWLPIGAVILGGLGFGSQRRRKKIVVAMLGCVLSAGLVAQIACGGGNPPPGGGTPPGTYKITITGSAGSLQRSTTVTLMVQ